MGADQETISHRVSHTHPAAALTFSANTPWATLLKTILHSLHGTAMPDLEIVMSPLCREITGDGIKIQVDIYRGENDSGWILEVIDEENASTVWDDPFDTDREALDEVMEVIKQDGIRSFLESEAGVTL